MTRDQVLADGSIPPLGKLIIQALCEREHRVWDAKELAHILGAGSHMVAEIAAPLRARGFLDRAHAGQHLPLARLRMTDTARADYAPSISRSSMQAVAS